MENIAHDSKAADEALLDDLFSDFTLADEIDADVTPVAEVDADVAELQAAIQFDENQSLGGLIEATDIVEVPVVAEAEVAPVVAAKAKKEPKVKEPSIPRVSFNNAKPSDVLLSRLGGSPDEIVLEFSDTELSAEKLQANQQKLLELLNIRPSSEAAVTSGSSTQKKVGEKAIMLFSWLKSGGKMNEVMLRTFKVLIRDGHISTGDKGNLHLELLTKPYSTGTARAQSGQMMKLLPMLKIATLEHGKLVANPDSVILVKVKSELFSGE